MPAPALLQIFREPLKPGCEAAYAAIEEETARLAAALGCPHPYLGAESLAGEPEVWWLNGFASGDEKDRVYAAYAQNGALLAALRANSARKAALTLTPSDVLTAYRADLSEGEPWAPGYGRFLVVTSSRAGLVAGGTVFEAPDSVLYAIRACDTPHEARAVQGALGGGAVVLGVRPAWSFPDPRWCEADPGFWQVAPDR
ncbi:MAG TPA: hypothetical protein VH916_03830 [Dehalococcoidia bacterium]|jgi:hypothetical protein